jgi:hypothetical protein
MLDLDNEDVLKEVSEFELSGNHIRKRTIVRNNNSNFNFNNAQHREENLESPQNLVE